MGGVSLTDVESGMRPFIVDLVYVHLEVYMSKLTLWYEAGTAHGRGRGVAD